MVHVLGMNRDIHNNILLLVLQLCRSHDKKDDCDLWKDIHNNILLLVLQLYRSHDKKDDCDLWKDSFFKARVTRYLCVTRVYPLDGVSFIYAHTV